jgi:4-oxalocrotonate tautomerase
VLSFASLVQDQSAEYRRTLEEIVCQTMIDIINVPNDDKFQTIAEHALEELNFPAGLSG